MRKSNSYTVFKIRALWRIITHTCIFLSDKIFLEQFSSMRKRLTAHFVCFSILYTFFLLFFSFVSLRKRIFSYRYKNHFHLLIIIFLYINSCILLNSSQISARTFENLPQGIFLKM